MISTSYCQQCLCGRSFDDTGAFTRHKKICLKSKKRLANVLSHTKESYRSKKCRIEDEGSVGASSQIVPSNTVSRHGTMDDALGATLEGSNTLDAMDIVGLSQTKVLNETRVSRADQVCVCFLLGFF